MPAPPPRPSGPPSSRSTSACSACEYDDVELLGRFVTDGPRGVSDRAGACTSRTAPCSARCTRTRPAGCRSRPCCAGRSPGWPSTSRPGRAPPRCRACTRPPSEMPQLWGSSRAFAQATWRHLLFGDRAGRARAAPEPARLRAARRSTRPRPRPTATGRPSTSGVDLELDAPARVFITGATGFAGRHLVAACEADGRRRRRRAALVGGRSARPRRRARARRRRAARRRLPPRRARPRRRVVGGPARHARRQRRDDRERARGGAPRGARGGRRRRSARARSTARRETVPTTEDDAAAPAEPVRGLQGLLRARRALLRRRLRAARDPRPRVQPRRPGPGADLRDRELRPPDRATASRAGEDAVRIVTGSPDTRRDFTDVRDVVRAYRLLAARGEPGAYNVCSGVSRSARELIAGARRGRRRRRSTTRSTRPSVRAHEVRRSAAPPTASTPPPAGRPRSRSSRPSRDTLAYWR